MGEQTPKIYGLIDFLSWKEVTTPGRSFDKVLWFVSDLCTVKNVLMTATLSYRKSIQVALQGRNERFHHDLPQLDCLGLRFGVKYCYLQYFILPSDGFLSESHIAIWELS